MPAGLLWATDLSVTNDQTYYYQIQANFVDGTSSVSNTLTVTPSIGSFGAYVADELIYLLERAGRILPALEGFGAEKGETIAEKISLYDIKVGFGSCNNHYESSGRIGAWFETTSGKVIRIDLDQLTTSYEAMTAVLAHEGTHAWWFHDTTQGQPLRAGVPDDPGRLYGDSIDQEYHAFLNQANVWADIGVVRDGWQDSNLALMLQGEAVAKEFIRELYWDPEHPLPEY